MTQWFDLCARGDIPEGEVIERIAGERTVALYALSDGVFATAAICT
ncbi:MAG: non-heme iron oxygenase ferredoxin subunit, partial [Rubrivivax sp.]|nr:non-heme iron oxygenase ferredoxin subunit [Rubrivivax sp.]